jgi:thymidine kinase
MEAIFFTELRPNKLNYLAEKNANVADFGGTDWRQNFFLATAYLVAAALGRSLEKAQSSLCDLLTQQFFFKTG